MPPDATPDPLAALGALPDPDWYLDHVLVPSGIERRPVGPVRAWQGSWAGLATRLRTDADDTPLGAAVRLALEQGFVLDRRQLRDCGVADAAVRRLLRRGEWTACAYGCVAVVPAPTPGTNPRHDDLRRAHSLRAASAALRHRGHVVGGTSAAIMHGLPVLDIPQLPELVTDAAATFGRRAAARVRYASCGAHDLDDWFGAPLLGVARSVVDVARFDAASGLMAAGAALHEGVLTTDAMKGCLDGCAGRSGIRRAREVLGLASSLIESPLESLTRLALHDSGFPAPQLQVRVRGADGKRYRVDFLWPEHRLILEADGRAKYTADALWKEKRRELALMRVGYRVVRVTWQDVRGDWPSVCAWLREEMAGRPAAARTR